jgi:hypothetical protein
VIEEEARYVKGFSSIQAEILLREMHYPYIRKLYPFFAY